MNTADKQQIIIISVFILAAISFFLDDLIFSIVRLLQSDITDYMMQFLSSQAVIAVFFITASIFLFRKTKQFIILWASLITTAIIVTALKLIIERGRPEEMTLFLLGLPDYSFPSMHTALMFAMIYILSKSFQEERIFFIVYASLVGISRIYLGMHHFSDVIFGALIGFMMGYFTYKTDELHGFSAKIYKNKKGKTNKRR